MARARNIKPAFFKNEDLALLSPHARLLFIGLWCLADVKGRLEDRPSRIRAELFPYEAVDVNQLLNELAHSEGSFLTRYSVNEKRFIEINNFCLHQNPHQNEKKAGSKIPSPVMDRGKSTVQERNMHQTALADSLLLIPDSLNLKPDDQKISPVGKPTEVCASKKQESELFDDFWKQYPRKVNKLGSLTYWMKNNLDSKHKKIIDSVTAHKRSEQWNCENGKYVPHPLTFLRQERYSDLSLNDHDTEPISNTPTVNEKKLKRDALLNFPYIRLEGVLVESAKFTVDDSLPDQLFAFGNSYAVELLEGVNNLEEPSND